MIQKFFFSSFRNFSWNAIENVFLNKYDFVTTNCFKTKIHFSFLLKCFANKNKIIFCVAKMLTKLIVSKFWSWTIDEITETCFRTIQFLNLLNFLKQTLIWNSFQFRLKMKFDLKLWQIANNFSILIKNKI